MVDRAEIDVDLFAVNDAGLVLRHPAERILADESTGIGYLPLNMAVPPFDDVHVRRAVNLVVDRSRMLREYGPVDLSRIAWHVAPDHVLEGLLEDWRPAWSSDPSGDATAAMAEMRRSRYDRDGDGRCDDEVCRDVRALAWRRDAPYVELWDWSAIVEALRTIGIVLDVTTVGPARCYRHAYDPSERWGIVIGCPLGWYVDYPNGSVFFEGLMSSGHFTDPLLIGEPAEQLGAWGYDVTEVPNIDDRIDACMPLTGPEQVRCWAELDQYVSTHIVPWIPLNRGMTVAAVSDRVVAFSFDASLGEVAFDQISLVPGSG
jgi:ABC-type transport system substrate-binding protein